MMLDAEVVAVKLKAARERRRIWPPEAKQNVEGVRVNGYNRFSLSGD